MTSPKQWVLPLVVLVGGLTMALRAQDITKGSITGVVRDATNAVVPNATVSLKSPNGERTTVTDSLGAYAFPNLTAGSSYNLTVTMSGFMTAQARDLSVGVNRQTTQDFTLQVGQAAQQVEVVGGSAGTIDLASTTVGGTLNQSLYDNTAVGRNVSSVVNMAPGVSNSAGAGAANPSINGASGLENQYFVDGANITDPGFGGFGTYSRNFGSEGTGVTFDFISEVQVLTGGFEAQYGQALGGIVNVITKSGGNAFHGSLYGYFAPTGLAVQNRNVDPLLVSKIDYVQTQSTFDFGGDFGGHIIKDKLFFYGGFNPVFNNSYRRADPEFGNFSLGLVNVSSRTMDYTGKINWNISSKHQLEGSVFGDPSTTPTTYNRGLNSNDNLRTSALDFGSRTWTGRYTGTLTNSLILTANYSEYFNKFHETPQFNGYEMTDNTPVQDGTGSAFNYNGLGYLENTESHTHQFNTSASWVKSLWGQHTFQIGYQFEDDPYADYELYSGPDFTLPNDPVLGPAAGQTVHGGYFVREYEDGDPTQPIVLELERGNYSSPNIATDTRYHAGYIQDTWSIGRRITIKPGLRFEQQELAGNDARYVFGHNWAPRIGIIVDPTGNRHTKFFANWGRFFEKVPLDIAVRSLSQETGFSGGVFYADPGPGQPANTDPSQFLSSISGTTGLTGASPTIIYGGTGSQYQDEIVGGYEHEFSDSFTVSARFTYRHLLRVLEDEQGTNITQGYDVYSYPDALAAGAGVPYVIGNPSAKQDIFQNQTRCSGPNSATCIDGWTPPNGTPGPDGVPDGFPNPSRIYKAMEIVVSRRFSTNFQFYGSYVLSKLYGNYEGNYRADNGQIDPNISSMFDFTNTDGGLNYQYAAGVLPTDRRHQVKLYGTYTLGKVNLGLAWNIQSGSPITGYLDHPVYTNAGEIPNGPRGAYGRTPWDFPLNLHADYTLKLGETKALKFGADLFNVMNRSERYYVDQYKELDGSPGTPNPDFLLPTFHEVSTGYAPPFSARLMVRFEF